MPILYGLFTFWVKPFEIFCQPHNWVLFPIFLATERCLCYANLVWIIYILIQAFLNLLSTTQLSFVFYVLSNWKVSMLWQSCMNYLHFELSLSKSFVNHTTQFYLLFSEQLKGVYVMPNLYGLFPLWVKPFEIFCQPHSSVLFAIFLATKRCPCYANLVWIIYIMSQAFRNLLSTTQLSFVCYFLSNWKVSMLCQTCMDYFHYESSLSKSFVYHTTQFCLLFS